nr:uncharacterized protein LOC111109663 isoform X2 [Crassostrea virginica]
MTIKIAMVLVLSISVDNNLTRGSLLKNESDCHTTLITSKGFITSQPFGDDLQPWLHCDWLVILPERSQARLNFLSFDLPPAESGHCKQGFLLLGIVDTEGNRRSELGPICGTDSPGVIPLPSDKFWVSLFRVPAIPGQRSNQYGGFSLNFTHVLNPVHESAGLDSHWYALILLAAPFLVVIPLYVCLRRRRSMPIYCSNQNTTEMVVQRFQRKHRPHFRSILEKSGNIQITISAPSEDMDQISGITEFSYNGGSGDYENVRKQHNHRDDFSLFKNLYVPGSAYASFASSLDSPVFIEGSQKNNKSYLNSHSKSKFLTIPRQSNRKSRTSYLSILPDFESTLDHSKIESAEQLNQIKYSSTPASLGQVDDLPSLGHVDDKAVYVIQDEPVRNHPVIPIITITSASLRRKKRLSTVRNPEDTSSSDSALRDRKTGQRFRGSVRPKKNARVWQSEDDSSTEAGDEEPNNREPEEREHHNKEPGYKEADGTEPGNVEPGNTETGYTDPCLTVPDNKELIGTEPGKTTEPGNMEPCYAKPGNTGSELGNIAKPGTSEPRKTDEPRNFTPSQAIKFHMNKSTGNQDSYFGFSTPSIMLYKDGVDGGRNASSLDDERLMTGMQKSIISCMTTPHVDPCTESQPDNLFNEKDQGCVLLDEIMMLHKQLSQPQLMGVDNVAFHDDDDDDGDDNSDDNGRPDNRGKVIMNCEGFGYSDC